MTNLTFNCGLAGWWNGRVDRSHSMKGHVDLLRWLRSAGFTPKSKKEKVVRGERYLKLLWIHIKKRRRHLATLESILFILPSLIDIHWLCLLPCGSSDRDTYAVRDQCAHPRFPFISQSPSKWAYMRQFWVFILKRPHVSKPNWSS